MSSCRRCAGRVADMAYSIARSPGPTNGHTLPCPVHIVNIQDLAVTAWLFVGARQFHQGGSMSRSIVFLMLACAVVAGACATKQAADPVAVPRTSTQRI